LGGCVLPHVFADHALGPIGTDHNLGPEVSLVRADQHAVGFDSQLGHGRLLAQLNASANHVHGQPRIEFIAPHDSKRLVLHPHFEPSALVMQMDPIRINLRNFREVEA